MAKRNSTKTATREAQAASEPRIINFGQWTGINIKEAPLGWADNSDQPGQSDLPDNYLMLQNNVVTTSLKALETRLDTLPVCLMPYEVVGDATVKFKGISYLHENKLFAVVEMDPNNPDFQPTDSLWCYVLENDKDSGAEINYDKKENWVSFRLIDKSPETADPYNGLHITSVYVYADTLIVLGSHQPYADNPHSHNNPFNTTTGSYEIYTGKLSEMFPADGKIPEGPLDISSTRKIPDPTTPLILTPAGDLQEDRSTSPVCRVSIRYCYTNQFGSTLSSDPVTINLNYSPVEFHSGRFLILQTDIPEELRSEVDGKPVYDINGVDFYCAMNESQDYIFIGHANLSENAHIIYFNWFGALNDTTQWTSVQLTPPTSNDTTGVDAAYVNCHDGRLYFWGGSIKNRLYIGGDPGSELSVARGLGGGFVDLDPGTGLVINSTHKFKTYNGASIVTIMCGNKNTGKVKRFNLLETNLTVTNELQSKGYEAEEVPNVIGCNSPWGAGVWENGLYALSRYGLGVTTMQMEESNTLSVQYVSDAIQPVFTDQVSAMLKNCRMIYVDGVIYFALAIPSWPIQPGDDEPVTHDEHLDNLIFCYDIAQKAFYTLSYDLNEDEKLVHIFNFDYDQWHEGIGLITDQRIVRIPVTGGYLNTVPEYTALIETGELGLRIPPQLYIWLAQLEFRFDYIIGELDIEVFGVDYYGRHYRVYHHVDTKGKLLREYPVWMRIDKNVQTYRIRIKGKAHFRMTHFMSKTYQQSDKMALVYGYDSHAWYKNRDGGETDDHHYLESYNNLREAIVV